MPFRPAVIRDVDRTDQALVQQLAKFGVATIHEANSRTGLMYGITPVTGGVRIAGTAITSLDFAGDNVMLQTAIEVARPGDVLIAAVTAPSSHGMFGDLLATSCQARGITAVVLAAAARDAAVIREMGFPVWSHAVCAAGTVKVSPGWVNVPVSCGGAVVNPGDVVIADDDGVVVVARQDAAQVLAAARQREDKEAGLRQRFAAGEASVDISGLRALTAAYEQGTAVS